MPADQKDKKGTVPFFATDRKRRHSPGRQSPVPGFGLTLGFTLAYLSLLVLIPLAGVFVKAAGLGVDGLWDALASPRVFGALRITGGNVVEPEPFGCTDTRVVSVTWPSISSEIGRSVTASPLRFSTPAVMVTRSCPDD